MLRIGAEVRIGSQRATPSASLNVLDGLGFAVRLAGQIARRINNVSFTNAPTDLRIIVAAR